MNPNNQDLRTRFIFDDMPVRGLHVRLEEVWRHIVSRKQYPAAIRRALGELLAAGADVFLDDRDERAGVLLNDSELLGIPHRIVIGDRALKEGNVEYAERRDNEAQTVPTGEIAAKVLAALK